MLHYSLLMYKSDKGHCLREVESEAFLSRGSTNAMQCNGAGDDQGRLGMHRHLHQGAIIFSTKEQSIFEHLM